MQAVDEAVQGLAALHAVTGGPEQLDERGAGEGPADVEAKVAEQGFDLATGRQRHGMARLEQAEAAEQANLNRPGRLVKGRDGTDGHGALVHPPSIVHAASGRAVPSERSSDAVHAPSQHRAALAGEEAGLRQR